MDIIKAFEVKPGQNPHCIEARNLLSTEYVQVAMVTLKPGEGCNLHMYPVDTFFYVLEGTGKVEMAGEIQELTADLLVYSPAQTPHRLFNESDATFRFLVVKTPGQAEGTRLL